jgi:hypothetical protein
MGRLLKRRIHVWVWGEKMERGGGNGEEIWKIRSPELVPLIYSGWA